MNRSRIQVIRDDTLKFRTLVCVNCKNPKCIEACPVDAITKDANGSVLVNPEKCIGCMACVKACNRMFFDYVDNKAINCDLCGACVSECPEEALSIKTIGEKKV
jgi:Fe-S-cluster-containing dehydrogenase component